MNDRNPRLAGLLSRIAQCDEDAMTELYEWTRPFLSNYIRRIVRDIWTAEEVLQDVYRQVWTSASRFQPERGKGTAWLYLIARSRALDSLRKRSTDHSQPMLDGEEQRIPALGREEERYLNVSEYAKVRQTVFGLPESQRHMIRLAFFEGYSHSEIADETGLPLGTVKTRIRTGLHRMREILSTVL